MPKVPPKKNSWQYAQSKAKLKRKTKLAVSFLVFIAVLIILGQLVNFTKILFSPWNFSAVKDQQYWDEQFNINLVLKAKFVSVFSYNPTEKKITILTLPDETYFDLPQMLGKWQLRSVFDLGGGILLKDSLVSFLGIPIDGILEFGGPLSLKSADEIVSLLHQNPTNIFTILPNLKTDLTLWDFIRLKMAVSGVRFDKVQDLDLLKLNVLDKVKLSDGSEVFTADPIRLESVLTGFKDPKIQSEHLSIAVFNATTYPNLAQKAAMIINNLGGNVIIIGNTDAKGDKSVVFGTPSATLKRLTQIFGSECSKCDKINIAKWGIESSRAQINIILGEDFFLRFGNK